MPKVTIFSTTICAYCKAEKQYLTSKGITYEEVMVDQDLSKATYLLETFGTMGVPFTHIVNDDGSEAQILGFDKPKLNAALGL